MAESHASLLSYIEQRISLSEEEQQQVISGFSLERGEKNTILVQTEERSERLYFILKGFVRCFYLDEQGNEVTAAIMGPKQFVTAFDSFVHEKPSRVAVQCITDAKLLSISKAKYNEMYELVTDWAVFCNSLYEDYISRNNKRMHALQHLSAGERYRQLMEQQPELVQHTPIKYLASYLGIRPQSLSRIRKSLL